jgi:hypothetical protein
MHCCFGHVPKYDVLRPGLMNTNVISSCSNWRGQAWFKTAMARKSRRMVGLIREGKKGDMQSDSVNQHDGLFLVRVCERHSPSIKRPSPLEATLPHCNTNSDMNKICPSHPTTCASPTSGCDKGWSWNSDIPLAWHKPCPLLHHL